MSSRQIIKAIFSGQSADRPGFWMGYLVKETQEKYFKYFDVSDREQLASLIGDDIYHIMAEGEAWKHPDGKPLWNAKLVSKNLIKNVFAECEDIKEIENYDWPDPDFLDYGSVIKKMDMAISRGQCVFGGPWTYIFQLTVDFFGMENLFVKMYTDPLIVEAVIEKITDFYMAANRMFFDAAGDRLDAFFFANDLGGQENLLISPELFRKFFLPGFSKIIALAKSYNYKVIMHSCGAVSKIIPDLIDAGIDGLHPLQAKAKGMDAESLSRQFKNDLVFFGGVDSQELLPFGTPEQVKNEVRRLKKVFGGRFIVSPSHESVLPNIKPENIIAMRDAAYEK